MNLNNSRTLNERYPKLYRRLKRGPIEGPLIPIEFGFQCGDGWFDLLDKLSAKLETEIEKQPVEEQESFYAFQVKEKYGTLRFYMSSYTDEIDNLIQEAEKESEKTCETCGKEGELRGHSWLYTSCEEHSRENKDYGVS